MHRFIAEGPEGLLDRRAHNGGRKVDARLLPAAPATNIRLKALEPPEPEDWGA